MQNQPLTIAQDNREELIKRYEKRKREVYYTRNPYTTPIIEFREICDKINELKKIKP